jgi:hypothetical protein
MLLVPWAIGVGLTRRPVLEHAALQIVALALFVAHTHVITCWRARLGLPVDRATLVAARTLVAGLTAVALAGAGVLVVRVGAAVLAPFAVLALAFLAASLWLVRRRLDHMLPGQLLAALALPLTGPAAWTVTSGVVDRIAVALWLLNAAFFVGAVLYVRLEIAARARPRELATLTARVSFAASTLAADVLLLAAAFVAIRLGGLSPLALVAFVSVGVHAVVGVLRLHRPAALKRLGLIATGHAVAFAALVIALA